MFGQMNAQPILAMGTTNPGPQHSNQKEVTISMSGQKLIGISGLPLARRAMKILKQGGIFAHSLLSVEHQELAKRYVICGLESGGSVGESWPVRDVRR
jgi:hypothetical protein